MARDNTRNMIRRAIVRFLEQMDATLSIEPRNTRGSTENIPLIEAGKIHLGQVTGARAAKVDVDVMETDGAQMEILYRVATGRPSGPRPPAAMTWEPVLLSGLHLARKVE